MLRLLVLVLLLKSFQNGHQRLEKAGLTVSLCKVASLEGNKVTLVGEE